MIHVLCSTGRKHGGRLFSTLFPSESCEMIFYVLTRQRHWCGGTWRRSRPGGSSLCASVCQCSACSITWILSSHHILLILQQQNMKSHRCHLQEERWSPHKYSYLLYNSEHHCPQCLQEKHVSKQQSGPSWRTFVNSNSTHFFTFNQFYSDSSCFAGQTYRSWQNIFNLPQR